MRDRWCAAALVVGLVACGDEASVPAAGGGGSGGGAVVAGASGMAGEASAAGAAGAGASGGGPSGRGGVSGSAGSGGQAPVLPPLPTVEGLNELVDLNPDPAIVEVELRASKSEAQILEGATTNVWTYNEQLPGPLLHARVGDRVVVHFTNELTEPTVVHWHGLRISDQMDGSPRIQKPVQPGETFTYDFIVPDAGTYWYHTHLKQIQQLERGLYGAIVVHEAEPIAFTRERLVVVDDIRLTNTNQISAFLTSGPDIGRGRVGNTLLVNGSAKPVAATIARGAIERWRVVLTTNALSFDLRTKGADVRVIATDGGLLPDPFALDTVTMAPGQRYELEVRPRADADEVSLEALILTLDASNNVVQKPYPLVRAVVQGEVTATEPVYPKVTLPPTDVASEVESWKISGSLVGGKPVFTINGQASYADDHEHPLLRTFATGVPQRLELSSDVSPEHPFHVHGQFFQIVARNGKPVAEPGLRDTVLVRGNEKVTVLSYFDNPGRWMVHCHISEHSENGMMAEIQVGDGGSGGAGGDSAHGAH